MAISSVQMKRLQKQIKKLRSENLWLRKQLREYGKRIKNRTRRTTSTLRQVEKSAKFGKERSGIISTRECLVIPPMITASAQRARLLRALTERMLHNPIPAGATKLTREELHERR